MRSRSTKLSDRHLQLSKMYFFLSPMLLPRRRGCRCGCGFFFFLAGTSANPSVARGRRLSGGKSNDDEDLFHCSLHLRGETPPPPFLPFCLDPGGSLTTFKWELPRVLGTPQQHVASSSHFFAVVVVVLHGRQKEAREKLIASDRLGIRKRRRMEGHLEAAAAAKRSYFVLFTFPFPLETSETTSHLGEHAVISVVDSGPETTCAYLAEWRSKCVSKQILFAFPYRCQSRFCPSPRHL